MKDSMLIRIVAVLAVYFGLKYLGGSVGQMILYPVTLLVTFLHEFGHALGAILTGGSVEALEVSKDGSGFTMTRGGSRGIILMGGYIGSAILGNLLIYIGTRHDRWSSITLKALAIAMIVSGIIWFNSFWSSGFLIAFSIGLFFIANNTSFDREVLLFLGFACILYIIQDFNVGPRSDLKAYAELFVFIPATIWMYIWLGIVILLCFFNIKLIYKSYKKEQSIT